jgi:asparagine synthase (glutamine-hydrolysing)
MCGVAGFMARGRMNTALAQRMLERMNGLQQHRGPDGVGTWIESGGRTGLAHRRLSIIDLATGDQPMASLSGNVITYNGEIYNYIELRKELGEDQFTTTSDTEVILRAYERWGESCVEKLRGMFAFALWDAAQKRLFFARDRFGIKPFYYTVAGGVFYFASEMKALLPFVDAIETDLPALHDYFSFQFCLGDKTLFRGVKQLNPAHCGYVDADLNVRTRRYWEVHYDLDWRSTEEQFIQQVRQRLFDSIGLHLRSDVEVGAYVSGGIDSSLVAALGRECAGTATFQAFTGKFSIDQGYDESGYARLLAGEKSMRLHEIDITEGDFVTNIAKVIYHLDVPVAGPGSFPQYMVSRMVREHVKVVLGGQGGDEIFGGYARYLLAYFEQCIKGAIDGSLHNGNFVVTYESIIPNLRTLENYRPLIQEFWADGIFDARDRRYFRLINRCNTFGNIVDWRLFDGNSSFEEFKAIYWGHNVGKESYFDSMTHFDFKTLLPALLHVEDRMSMAHGVESRVPFLDHRLVELVATIPANVKFQNGELKRLLRTAFSDKVPHAILQRKDKMGFPVPLQLWTKRNGSIKDFIFDTFRSEKAKARFYFSSGFDIERLLAAEGMFSRNLWAFLSLELWQQQFHDRQTDYRTA